MIRCAAADGGSDLSGVCVGEGVEGVWERGWEAFGRDVGAVWEDLRGVWGSSESMGGV